MENKESEHLIFREFHRLYVTSW